jgi:hypothetical protein
MKKEAFIGIINRTGAKPWERRQLLEEFDRKAETIASLVVKLGLAKKDNLDYDPDYNISNEKLREYAKHKSYCAKAKITSGGKTTEIGCSCGLDEVLKD